jgi:putative ABC transport system permease protein
MISIARKNMRAEKLRFAFSVSGVAVAALLLAFMLALYSGWNERIASYVKDVPADIWVVQKGNESFFSASLIPEDLLEQVRDMQGVEDVSVLLGRGVKLTYDGETYDSYVLGFDVQGPAGPLHMKKGSREPGPGQIVIDDVLARTAGIGLDDEVLVGERAMTVIGISSGGNQLIYQLSFVSKDEARAILGVDGVVNFGLVTTEEGREQEVIDNINSTLPFVTAFGRQEFAESSRKLLTRSLLPILSVMLGLVFIVGAVVVGLTIYTATIEKEREFGVMKALGAPNRRLIAIVVEQSLACCLVGFVIGEIAVLGASRLAERLVPQFVTLIRWQDALIVLAAAAIMSVIAAYLPLQRVLRVDPLKVFKA